jgi:8-oxo-dGTP pyrophosphatase MutT (NUDIX family)
MEPQTPTTPTAFSAGVVVISCQSGKFRYLLLRSYKNWDFPKGHVEPGEMPLAAARREVKEEADISTLDFHWGEVYVETEPYARGKVARYYVALTPSMDVTLPISPELGRPEHQEYRWADYEEGCRLVVPRVRAVLDWARGLVEET